MQETSLTRLETKFSELLFQAFSAVLYTSTMLLSHSINESAQLLNIIISSLWGCQWLKSERLSVEESLRLLNEGSEERSVTHSILDYRYMCSASLQYIHSFCYW